MRVAVYEPIPTGHHFAYLSLLMPALAELATELVLVTSEAARSSPQYAIHLGNSSGLFQVDTGIQGISHSRSPLRGIGEFRSLSSAVRRIQPDRLYVPYGDGLVAGASFGQYFDCWPRERTESEVLFLRGGFSYPPSSLRRRAAIRLLPKLIGSGPWDWIHHINPDDVAVLREQRGTLANRCTLIPDPVEPPSELNRVDARRKLNVPEQGRYIGCAGAIDSRKGMDLLLHAFQEARRNLASNDRLLLAGPFEPKIKRLVEHEMQSELRAETLILIDRHLSVTEMNDVIAALDVVCTPYPRHQHSASIVIRAATHNRYVLGNKIGWMGKTIARFGLGDSCDVQNPEAFARAIPKSLDAAAAFTLAEAGRRFARYHSSENFSVSWVAKFRERLGLPADPRMIPWEWVLEALQ